ncbi:MAG: spore coat protein [Sporomusaceae bacterium]|nr:spore coat protein [Sporomusaceae bacterium]
MAQNQQQNQQQNQMQSGQQGQCGDQELLNLALNEIKYTTQTINLYITEASSNQLRQDYMTVLGDVYGQQKQLFDFMQQKGYYQVKQANPQEVSQVQSKFSQQMQ